MRSVDNLYVMNLISIDLPWNPAKKGRRTLAMADRDKHIQIGSADSDEEMLKIVREQAEPGDLVLLDIPIEGCESLGRGHFRPVDKALSRQRISLLPASKSGYRGRQLKERLERENLKVIEIYPYAIYKFLAYLKEKNQLPRLNSRQFNTLLDNDFLKYSPPKYKRERNKIQRLENLSYLYSLLTVSIFGLKFSPPLRHPDPFYTRGGLEKLGDEYDACLGALVGIYYFFRKSCYTHIIGDEESGNMLLFADKWLLSRLEKEVQITSEEE